MRKRLIAIVCMAALFIGALASGAVAANTTETFLVGYSRVDINPYVDPTLKGKAKFADKNIMHLPLRGSGSVWQRPSTKLVDDNYDGVIDENDGLAVTCIAIQSGDKTVLMITIDLIGSSLIKKVRAEVCSRVASECGVTIGEDEIFYAGTHTHTAPDTSVVGNRSSNNNYCVGTDGVTYDFTYAQMDAQLSTWIDRTIENVGTAAVNAVNDLEAAELIKDEIDADDYTNLTMNATRHYYRDPNTKVYGDEYYYGDNFNYRVAGSATNYVAQAHEVDDVMYLLKFRFASGSGKDPVVLASWRGHPSLNNTNSYNDSSKNGISSDYVNAFRCRVEASGYRVAFFQGNGGNVNPRGYAYNSEVKATDYAWIDTGATKAKTSRGNFYGDALGEMALQGLTDGKNEQMVQAGPIQTSQVFYYGGRKPVTELAYKAAVAYTNGELTANSPASTYTYTDPETGETYTIASKFHASNIISDWNAPINATVISSVKMELNAVLLGKGAAFVTVPGEPFDYYNAYDEQGNPYNAWEDLIDTETYGKPIVLGYCNGAVGYIPSYEAYQYNSGTKNTTVAVGSYEAQCTPLKQGTGELMVKNLDLMLEAMASDRQLSYQGSCAHCSGTVTWQPYNGETTLNTGHYYLMTDAYTKTISVANGSVVCFNMNGHTLTGEKRAFNQSTESASTLNLMDMSEEQTGEIQGNAGRCGAGAGWGGGVIYSNTGCTLNLYSGTLRQLVMPSVYKAWVGGVLLTKGVFNMYGGTVIGGEVCSFTGSYANSSGTVFTVTRTGKGGAISTSGNAFLYGGTIIGGVHRSLVGTVENSIYHETDTGVEIDTGTCLYVSSGGNVTVSGDVRIDDIYCEDLATGLTVSGTFTGRATVSAAHVPEAGTVVGTGIDALIPGQTILIAGTDLVADVSDEALVVGEKRAVSVYYSKTDTYVCYDSFAQALAEHTDETTCIVLNRDLTENVTLTRDVYLDLNGCDIIGNIENTGHTLYCMDSQTNDYTVADASGELTGYGKLCGTVTGSLEPVPADAVISQEENGYRPGYLKLVEGNAVSFHRVDLDVRYLYLDPGEVSMFYESVFAGDEVVAANVESFGVAVSICGEPRVVDDALSSDCLYSGFSGDLFVAGRKDDMQLSATGSTLVNIITKQNSLWRNQANASTPVYGCSYIKIGNRYILGPSKAISLRQSVEILDDTARYWDAIQTAQIVEMYQTYSDVMAGWDIPNIIAANRTA